MPAADPRPLLEVVPNVGAGRDRALVEAFADAVRAGIRAGAQADDSSAVLADVHADDDHDRSVFTILGRGEALARGMEALARASVEALDVHASHGVHPRIGVLDVVPVVALQPGNDGHGAAHELAERIARVLGDELRVPCVRYGLDPVSGERLEGAGFTGAVRAGGAARAIDRARAGELQLLTDVDELHPSAGMTIVGVRDVLVAFNVDLAVDDLDAARMIAAQLRESGGGPDALPGVRALGMRLPRRTPPHAQVSTNVERHQVAGPARVLETVVRLAADAGVAVERAELVGLAPESALGALRYACMRLGVPLAAAAEPSLDAAISRS